MAGEDVLPLTWQFATPAGWDKELEMIVILLNVFDNIPAGSRRRVLDYLTARLGGTDDQ